MLKTVLVDDEVHSLNELIFILDEEENIKIIKRYSNSTIAFEEMSKNKPDIVFIDIDISKSKGINLAKKLISQYDGIDVIFVSSYNKYAFKAFELNITDYIPKPIQKKRLKKSLQKIYRKNIQYTKLPNNLSNIEKFLNQNLDKILIQHREEIVFVKIKDILFIESELKHTYVKTKNEKYTTRITLNSWEKRLKDSGFFRCHRSFLVNLNYIKKIFPMFRNNYIIKQESSNIDIPISRHYLKKLKQFI